MQAIRGRDVKTLTRIPGVGKKTAEKICFELSEKLGGLSGPGRPGGVSLRRRLGGDLRSALTNLGFKEDAVLPVVADLRASEAAPARGHPPCFEGLPAMSTRILSTSPLVGPALAELGARFPDLCLAPFRSPAWNAGPARGRGPGRAAVRTHHGGGPGAAPKLKVIGTYSVGVNHLPVQVCQARGIPIVNTPGVLTEATADLALALLLAVTRRVAEGEALVRSGAWKGWAPDQLLGTGLAGKACGILGAGAIGKAFARRVWALGMKPVFWDREGRSRHVDFGAGHRPPPAPDGAAAPVRRAVPPLPAHGRDPGPPGPRCAGAAAPGRLHHQYRPRRHHGRIAAIWRSSIRATSAGWGWMSTMGNPR